MFLTLCDACKNGDHDHCMETRPKPREISHHRCRCGCQNKDLNWSMEKVMKEFEKNKGPLVFE